MLVKKPQSVSRNVLPMRDISNAASALDRSRPRICSDQKPLKEQVFSISMTDKGKEAELIQILMFKKTHTLTSILSNSIYRLGSRAKSRKKTFINQKVILEFFQHF
jgi:hypothetical protein